jgi:hypothetical protein
MTYAIQKPDKFVSEKLSFKNWTFRYSDIHLNFKIEAEMSYYLCEN